MAAIRHLHDPEGDAREVRDAEASLLHFRGLLKRPEVDDAIKAKAVWSIKGLTRWLANAGRREA